MSSEAREVDIAVIGGGTVGLSAAYYAAAAGYSTTLFEQFDFGNDRASSDGDSRMFRVMYSDPTMARLAEASMGQWHEIEAATGRTLLSRNGLLFYGVHEQSVEGDLAQCQQVMTDLGIPFTPYDRAGMLAAYPVFRSLPDSYVGLSQKSGASIVVKQSLATFAELAAQKGAQLLTHCAAKVRPCQSGSGGGEDGYCIDSAQGAFIAKHLILAPGAWSNNVLQAFGLQLDLTIWQMTVCYFDVDSSLPWPMWYEFGPTSDGNDGRGLYYGFPPLERPGSIKVSADFTNNTFKDPSQCTYQPDPAILAQMSSLVAQRFNGINATPQLPMTCLYTMSKDFQIILDTLPGHPNVALLSGESGRAFKYTPLFGRILVELATTGKSAYDIREFSINRPGLSG